MSKTIRDNYLALLAQLGLTAEELERKFVPVVISSDLGEIRFDGKTERAIAAFIYALSRRHTFPIQLDPNERIELMHYVTDDLFYDARRPITEHTALRALIGQGVSINVAHLSVC